MTDHIKETAELSDTGENETDNDMQVDSKRKKRKYSGLHGLRSPTWHWSNPELVTPTEDPTLITHSDLEIAVGKMIDPIRKELTSTTELLTKVNNELTQTRKELCKEKQDTLILKERLLKLEGFSRRYNLRFYGITENSYETKFDCKREVLHMLQHAGIVIPPKGIENAHRVGPKRANKNSKPRMIIAKFFHLEEKDFVLLKSDHIKWLCNVTIEEDYRRQTQNTKACNAVSKETH